jgi:hypothetical protein
MSFSTPYTIATKSTVTGTGSDANWYFAQRTNTDVATNLNNLTQTTVPMNGALTTLGTGWAINGNGIELTGPDSFVRCSFVVHVNASFNRGNMVVRLSRNGTLFGPVAAHGYIRNANGHQESSYVMGGTWIQLVTNDIITIETLREANAGTISMAAAGTSQLLLERLVNV